MSKGDAEHAGQHQHGVQVKQTGTVGVPVTEERIAAIESQIAAIVDLGKEGARIQAELATKVAALEEAIAVKAGKKEKAA